MCLTEWGAEFSREAVPSLALEAAFVPTNAAAFSTFSGFEGFEGYEGLEAVDASDVPVPVIGWENCGWVGSSSSLSSSGIPSRFSAPFPFFGFGSFSPSGRNPEGEDLGSGVPFRLLCVCVVCMRPRRARARTRSRA